jgi:hypothetical protein
MSGGTTSQATGVAVDPSTHEAVVVGQYAGTGLSFGSSTLNSAGNWDAFVARLSTTGAVKWVDSFGGAGLDQAKALAVDPSTGNLVVAGEFTGPATFGSASLSGFGGIDAFVAQLSPSGAVNWADQMGGPSGDVATSVAVGSGGAVTVGGSFQGTAAFGSTSLTSVGGSDAFVARLDSAGNVGWANGYGSAGSDGVSGVAVDATGRTTFVGNYAQALTFGSTTVPAYGTANIFVAQYTPPPSSAARFVVTGYPATTVAGTVQTFGVTAYDAYGDLDTSYTGTVHFTSSDPKAALPANYTFTAADGGQHTFGAVLETAGVQSIQAVDAQHAAVTGQEGGILVTPSTARSFTVAGSSTPTAGTWDALVVTAYDAYGNIATGYTGTVHFTTTDSKALLPTDYTFTAADAGVHTFGVMLKTAGAQAVRATDTAHSTITGVQTGIAVAPSSARSFTVAGPTTATAGAAENLVVTAYDLFGNVATGYTGTVHFTTTDSKAALPANYTFTAADAGKHTFRPAFKTAGVQAIRVTDTAHSTITGVQTGIADAPAAASSLGVIIRTSVTAGGYYSLVVTAYDAYHNVATGYTGTIHVTSTDPHAILPANYTFTASDKGTRSFSAILKTVGTQSITVTDTATSSVTGQLPGIAVAPGAASQFVLTYPTSTTAGTSQSFTVTAYDAYGNVATGYTGTVRFTSNDTHAVLPINYTFTALDAGVHTFSATLKTAGAEAIRARDSVHPTVTGVESGIAVSAAAASRVAVTGYPTSVTLGTPESFTVTLYDAFGNVATGYTGTMAFSSDDPLAALPGPTTFTTANAGQATFQATFKTAGKHWLKATDQANSALNGEETGIVAS